jgi:hypothetical protein
VATKPPSIVTSQNYARLSEGCFNLCVPRMPSGTLSRMFLRRKLHHDFEVRWIRAMVRRLALPALPQYLPLVLPLAGIGGKPQARGMIEYSAPTGGGGNM